MGRKATPKANFLVVCRSAGPCAGSTTKHRGVKTAFLNGWAVLISSKAAVKFQPRVVLRSHSPAPQPPGTSRRAPQEKPQKYIANERSQAEPESSSPLPSAAREWRAALLVVVSGPPARGAAPRPSQPSRSLTWLTDGASRGEHLSRRVHQDVVARRAAELEAVLLAELDVARVVDPLAVEVRAVRRAEVHDVPSGEGGRWAMGDGQREGGGRKDDGRWTMKGREAEGRWTMRGREAEG